MQVRTRRPSGVARVADQRATIHLLPPLHRRLREMPVERTDVVPVVEDDRDAVLGLGACEGDRAGRGRLDRRAALGADVDAGVVLGGGHPGGLPMAELGVHGAAHGPARRQRGEPVELVARRESRGRLVGERGAADTLVAPAGPELGPEGLPNPRVQLLPARDVLADVGDATVHRVDRALLFVDLLGEGHGLAREAAQLEPVAQQGAGRGDDDGDEGEGDEGSGSGKIEPNHSNSVAANDEQTKSLLAMIHPPVSPLRAAPRDGPAHVDPAAGTPARGSGCAVCNTLLATPSTAESPAPERHPRRSPVPPVAIRVPIATLIISPTYARAPSRGARSPPFPVRIVTHRGSDQTVEGRHAVAAGAACYHPRTQGRSAWTTSIGSSGCLPTSSRSSTT